MNRSMFTSMLVFLSFTIFMGKLVPGLAQIGSGNFPMANGTSSPSGSPSDGPSESPSGSLAGIARLNASTLLNFFHHMNTLEINEANNATLSLTHQNAIDYAQMMVTDHQQNEQQVMQLATQKGLTLYPFQESTDETAANTELKNISPPDFDRAYLQLQIAGHQSALQNLIILQSQNSDMDLQSLISSSISTIQKHLDQANAALAALGEGGGTSSPSPSGSPQP